MAGNARWLVTGACGQLGGHVTKRLTDRGAVVLGLSRRLCCGAHGDVRALDVRDHDKIDAVLQWYRPTHVVHLAGVSSPVAAERDPARAWELHAGVVGRLAEYVQATDGWLLYPSSDFIWDGEAERRYRESDQPIPRTIYGRTKVAGEKAAGPAGLVARFSLLYGIPVCPRDTTWTRWMRDLEQGHEIRACVDEFRTPLPLEEAARLILGFGTAKTTGLVHVAGPEVLTAKELVTRMATRKGLRPRIRAVSRIELPGGNARPRNMAMESSVPNRVFGVVIPAYHGANTLERSMNSLARQCFGGALRVVVAVNDGRADTFEAAQRLAPTVRAAGVDCMVIRSAAGRTNAIAAAENELPAGPRLYLDQDAALSPDAITQLADVLEPGTGVHFAAPRPRAVRPRSALSRAFYRAWHELPYVREAPVTMGAYAVSAHGRQRWAQVPEIHSDDKWVRWHFAHSERAVLRDGTYEVVLPEGVRELIRARRRYHRGNGQLRDLRLPFPDDSSRNSGAVRSLLARPTRWLESAVFLGVYSAAAVLNRCAR